jgi:hypothetical protein
MYSLLSLTAAKRCGHRLRNEAVRAKQTVLLESQESVVLERETRYLSLAKAPERLDDWNAKDRPVDCGPDQALP